MPIGMNQENKLKRWDKPRSTLQHWPNTSLAGGLRTKSFILCPGNLTLTTIWLQASDPGWLPVNPDPNASIADTDCLYKISYHGLLRESFSTTMSILSGTSSTFQMSPGSDWACFLVCFFAVVAGVTAETPSDAGVTICVWLGTSSSSRFSISAREVKFEAFIPSIVVSYSLSQAAMTRCSTNGTHRGR